MSGLQASLEQIARVTHEANRAWCQANGDLSQVPWDEAPDWQRDSAIIGVRAALRGATPEELHKGWCEHKIAEGWGYGPVKDADARIHPCLVPYDQLPHAQRVKDGIFHGVVRAFAAALFLPDCAVCRGRDLGTTDGPDGTQIPRVCGACTPSPPAEVFRREECVFRYCPEPGRCQDTCIIHPVNPR